MFFWDFLFGYAKLVYLVQIPMSIFIDVYSKDKLHLGYMHIITRFNLAWGYGTILFFIFLILAHEIYIDSRYPNQGYGIDGDKDICKCKKQ